MSVYIISPFAQRTAFLLDGKKIAGRQNIVGKEYKIIFKINIYIFKNLYFFSTYFQ